ncbi:MAG: AmmeMemoRadiSam system protein B [Elusimicrobiota bacterium]
MAAKRAPKASAAPALLPVAVLLLIPLLVHCERDKRPAAGSSGETSPAASARVRRSPLAGSWYLGDAGKLRARLGLYLERAGKPRLKGRPLALVSPHAGFRYSGQAAAYGFKALEGRDIRRVVVLGVSHRYPFPGASVPAFDHYETPLGRVPVDREAADRLLKHRLFASRSKVHEEEHSIEIQLPFLQVVLPEGFSIVPVVFSSLDRADYAPAAREIRRFVDDRTVVVASSDFVHYGKRFGYAPFEREIPRNIEALDREAIQAIVKKDFAAFYEHHERTGATICGRVPIGVLLNLLPEGSRGTLLRYYRSGELTGEWDGSVSYASILFTDGAGTGGEPDVSFAGAERESRLAAMLKPDEQGEILALARATVEAYVREKKAPSTEALMERVKAGLKKVMGVFVTLRKHGRLRGCIGSIVGVEPLYEGVVRNAVNACAFDRRFKPVTADELGDIEVEVSVLSPLRRVEGYHRILPGWHGVVLRKGGRSAVFLPQVAMENHWDVEETLTHLARKAGLAADAWKSEAEFHVFEAQIIPE